MIVFEDACKFNSSFSPLFQRNQAVFLVESLRGNYYFPSGAKGPRISLGLAGDVPVILLNNLWEMVGNRSTNVKVVSKGRARL